MWQKNKNYYHLLRAIFANVKHGFPSRNLTIIGVTGTDGKTTTTNLIYHILKTTGEKVAMVSTVGAAIGSKTYDVGFHVTSPSSFALQKYIKKAVNNKNKYLVLEVTSHGLDQNRVFGIKFAIGVLTNVSHEHLDYHKTYENYVKTKTKLLELARIAIVNKDDESYRLLANNKYITYGMDKTADINPQKFPFKTHLLGKFNQYNCLAAIAVCKNLGIEDVTIRKALASFVPPIGRQDIVYEKDFLVMIDFAHTPNSFYQILPEMRKFTKGRLIHVFGSASKRDMTKRPFMGEASARFADIIILTAEDPRNETVENINKEIYKGIEKSKFITLRRDQNSELELSKDKKFLFTISDRREAIRFAIGIANKGDTVLLTGKGHEKSMNYGKGEEPWDEYEEVEKALHRKVVNPITQLSNNNKVL